MKKGCDFIPLSHFFNLDNKPSSADLASIKPLKKMDAEACHISIYATEQAINVILKSNYNIIQGITMLQKSQLNSYISTLKHLVLLGRQAEIKLNKLSPMADIQWKCLYNLFEERNDTKISDVSAKDYKRWLHKLSAWAVINNIKSPNKLLHESATRFIKETFATKISSDRVLRFYKRVWRQLELDESVWPPKISSFHLTHEHYRRLSFQEIDALLNYLKVTSIELYDVVIIGYYTGLRLSDIVELEDSEISPDNKYLFLMPNKTRNRRFRKLTIPLVREAKRIIVKRRKKLYPDQKLFSPPTQHRTSRNLSAAFKKCDIKKINFGRASFHSLRSTFISLMDEAGVLPYITDAITGHSAGDMHSRYTQPSLNILRKAILKAIPPIGNG